MLFHSVTFLFAFLPVSVAVFYLIQSRVSDRAALLWFIVVSLFFYAWWNPAYLWLLLGSMVFNYLWGTMLDRSEKNRRAMLIAGVTCNLLLLGWFKYANFFVDSTNAVLHTTWTLQNIVLPLGISFFTFEQISWLVELYQRKISMAGVQEYCVFLTNFPKLIAGPIIRAHEMLPQVRDAASRRFRIEHLSVGLTIFFIGLTKKVVLADAMVPLVQPVFHASALGTPVTFFEAWGATLAFTFQLYFDFSGYTDMAIGCARLFGFILPLNFSSPYKSTNIAEFWNRWHMSLTRFLREYVYFPLGGSRVVSWKIHRNLLLTMLLSGLWHGAGWTFIAWGGLHGLYLILHRAWRSLRSGAAPVSRWWTQITAWMLTFVAVMVGWVFFRAESISSALRMLSSMTGLHGFSLPGFMAQHLGGLRSWGVAFDLEKTLILTPGEWLHKLPWIAALFAIALLLPNTQQIMRSFRPAYDAPQDGLPRGIRRFLVWKPTAPWAFTLACLTVLSLSFLILQQQTEFLYFQF